MDSIDRVRSLLHGEPVDYVPINDFFWPETLRAWTWQGYPTVGADHELAGFIPFEESERQERPISPNYYFGFDMNDGSHFQDWFDVMPIVGFSRIIDENEDWYIEENGAGAMHKYWKHKSGTPEHVHFAMTNRKVWEKEYRPLLLEVDRRRFNFGEIRRELGRGTRHRLFTYYDHLFLFEILRQSLGDICLYESLLLEPGWILDFNRVYTDFIVAHMRLLFQEVGKPDGVWVCEDLGYRNALFMSPRTYEELFFPFHKEYADFLRSNGVVPLFHSCGYIEEMLPRMIAAGFSAIHPMEVKAGCDALRFAEKHRDELTFVGGLDVRVLEAGDKERIRVETARLIKGMKSLGARYIFGSDHSISSNVSLDSFEYALQTYRELRGL